MYYLIPRAGRPPSPWMQSELGETTMALGQFILLVAQPRGRLGPLEP